MDSRSERTDPGRVKIGEDEGRVALMVNGIVQSVAVKDAGSTFDCWAAQVPDARPSRALILGLGGGTVAQLLTHRFGPVPIVGVECDAEVVDVARGRLGLDLPNLSIVIADAFEYVAASTERFDLICVDLYRGGEMERAALGKPFLRGVARLLSPNGTVVFNLFRERRTPQRLERLGQFFRIAKKLEVGGNVVTHCRLK